jgi:NarL family two-component system response regulator LiaR
MEAIKAPRTVRVVVADDHPTILRMVKQILEGVPHIQVVGDATDGSKAVSVVEELKPDVVDLNVVMPEMTGFQAARLIRHRRRRLQW